MNADLESVELTIYVRSGCHLCDDMLAALAELPEAKRCSLRAIDIDAGGDKDLVARYGSRVPVLERDGTFICEYFLDAVALRAALTDNL